MTPAAVHAASLAQLEALQPATFTWGGNPFPCLTGSTRRSKALEPGGFSLDADLVLLVRSELFGAGNRPGPKETITYNGNRYRIEDVVTPAGDPFLKLICVDANRAA